MFNNHLQTCSRMVRVCLLAVAVAVVWASQGIATERLPNIVLLLADDLGYGELGCYGQKWIETPHLDRLAAEGMRFTDFYAGNAVCAPSRCCLLTGKHPGRAYIRNNGDPKDLQYLKSKYGWEFPGQNPIPDAEVTIAEMLKQKDYATAAIGKWGLGHFGTSGDPNKQGFDLFYGFNCQRHAHNHYPRFLWRNGSKQWLPGNDRTLNGETYSQDKFTEEALEFIRQHKATPFFLYMPFAIPHLSIQVPEASLNQYKGKIPEAEYEHQGYLKHPYPRAGYAAMISHLDRDIGKIMAELKTHGLDEHTLVIFTSDNGPTYDRLGGSDSDFFESTAGFRGFKGSLYEGGIRVPMIARWTGRIAANTVSDRIAAFWDLMPTIADITGVTAPESHTGLSMLDDLLSRSARQPEYLYWEFPAYGGQQAIRRSHWKAIRQNMLRRDNSLPLVVELYDLASDRRESKNVASEHPNVVEDLTRLMDQARVPSERFPFRVLDPITESVKPGVNANFLRADMRIAEWLDRFEVESREVFAARKAVLDAVGLKPGDVVADIGAGTGIYTRLFSSQVADDGHVFAVEISPVFVRHLLDKTKAENLSNISVIPCRDDSTTLSPSSIDVAFICDTYHHFEYPKSTMASIHQALRSGGQLVLIDFERIPGVSREWTLGHVRAGKEGFRKEIEEAGFEFIEEVKIDGFRENYFLRFQRASD